jgi:3-oxoacyl-ACP reductase-like protein
MLICEMGVAKKAESSIRSTNRGMHSECSEEQFEKAPSAICTRFESGGKMTLSSNWQYAKQDFERICTDGGTTIDLRDEQRIKAEAPNRETLGLGSKETSASE